jgi:parallel beta-helix repeat protein
LRLNGNNQILYDVVHIDEPSPLAPSKTWYMSVVDNCIIEYGRVGIYCPVPGSVKINNCEIQYNDIGIKQLQEHFYVNFTVLWGNRIGADLYRANHFTWVKVTIAHCVDAGIQSAEDTWRVYQGAFIGCDFIDNNGSAFKGKYEDCRFIGCRIMNCVNGIESIGLLNCTIMGCYFQLVTGICIQAKVGNTIDGNVMHTCGIGIYVVLGGSGVITGNIIRYCTEPIVIDGTDLIVTNNQITETTKSAIKLDGGASGCIGIVISNNVIMNSSKEGAGLYSAIQILMRCNYGVISNNMIRDTTLRTKYAIEFASTAASIDTLVIGNVSRGMQTGGYYLRVATNQANNIGTVTTI